MAYDKKKIDYQSVFGNVLEYNESEEIQDVVSTKDSVDNSALEYYNNAIKQGEQVDIVFTVVTNKGTLVAYKDNVKIIMAPAAMDKGRADIVNKGRAARNSLVNVPISVRFTGIVYNEDTEEYVVKATSVESFDNQRSAAVNALRQMIANKDLTKIPAKVVLKDTAGKGLLLDIGGYNIRGYIQAKDWSLIGGNEALETVKTGDIVNVAVKGYKTSKEVRNKLRKGAFVCTRVTESRYKNLNKKFQPGMVVSAKLVACVPEKECCFLDIDGYAGVSLFAYAPWKRDEGYIKGNVRELVVGRNYKVLITVVDEEKKKFRGRIISELDGSGDEVLYKRVQRREMNGSSVASVIRESDSDGSAENRGE